MCETCLKFVSSPLIKFNVLKASRPVVMRTSDIRMLVGSQTFESQSKYKTLSISVRENEDHACWHATSKPPKRSDVPETAANIGTHWLKRKFSDPELYAVTTLRSALCRTVTHLKIHKENIELSWSYGTRRIFIRWRCVRPTYALTSPNPAAFTSTFIASLVEKPLVWYFKTMRLYLGEFGGRWRQNRTIESNTHTYDRNKQCFNSEPTQCARKGQ